jgi:hypothetical protein
VSGELTVDQVRDLLRLVALSSDARLALGQAIGANVDGPTYLAARQDANEAYRDLVDAIAGLQSGAAPRGAACEECGATTVSLHRVEPADPCHPDTVVLCRACLLEDDDTTGGAR